MLKHKMAKEDYEITLKMGGSEGKILDRYVATGLYGDTREEVAKNLLRDGLIGKLETLRGIRKEFERK